MPIAFLTLLPEVNAQDLLRHGVTWVLVFAAAFLANFFAKKVLVRAVRAIIERTRATWDDVFVQHEVFQKLSHVAPALVFYGAAPLLFPEAGQARYVDLVQRLANAWMILAGGRAANAFLDGIVTLGRREESTRDKPIRSYVQVVKIVLWLAVGILVVATLMQKSPWALLTGLGAMTAIMLLVFKDSILGFIASIQIASNDLVRVGDWVEVPRYGADGDVIDIGLHTAKVQNWDKTVAAVPTPAFLTEGFKNWRGMTESGGRRIKRSLSIDMTSVRFLEEADVERLSKIRLLADYLEERGTEIERWNNERSVDPDAAANGRRLTNLGTLRAYMQAYLEAQPLIADNMTFLVRQLAPGPEGIPLEIYVFSKEQRWVQYEGLISDIFDHLLAVLHEFDLRVYQRPTEYVLRS